MGNALCGVVAIVMSWGTPCMTVDQILDDLIRREGGYVHDPVDRGGPTKLRDYPAHPPDLARPGGDAHRRAPPHARRSAGDRIDPLMATLIGLALWVRQPVTAAWSGDVSLESYL